jgi:glucosamine--fructose-6-phosphate aminotransferase (isomerizing)
MISSESVAFGKYIQKYIALDNNDLIEISLTDNKISYATNIQRYKIHYADQNKHAELPPEHAHWMIKEIHDQPGGVINATGNGGRIKDNVSVKLGGLDGAKKYLDNANHLILLGCGTSYHAGLWSTRLFKEYDIFDTVSCIDGADFNIDDVPKRGKTIAILLSQSGETKDLHRCIDITRSYDITTVGVVNVEDSLIARETDCGVYLHAGREHAVASTKSFTNQCVVLSMIAVWFAQNKGVHLRLRQQCIADLHNLSYMLENVISNALTEIGNLVPLFSSYRTLFVLGKGECEAIARESSLKIKEVCYLHAEGYSTSALKHGPFALIENGLPIILIDVQKIYREKNINAYNELTSRNAVVIVITDEPSVYINIGAPREQILQVGKNVVFGGVLANTYIQLLSYKLAIERGHNPDYPRNLAKVVTVE